MKITCGEDNVKDFNNQLRLHLPGAIDLIKALISAGLMPGLRSTVLLTGEDHSQQRKR